MFGETIDIIAKTNFRKFSNAGKILSSYYFSRLKGSAQIRGMPVAISLEPTTSCNLRCPECPSGLRSFTRPTGMLDNSLVEKVLNELKGELAYLTFYFQGEPYLNKNFLDYVSMASNNQVYTATSTNAHFLTEEKAEETVRSGLDKLIISIDGTDQETFEKYRVGGNLQKVIEGTKTLVKTKKRLRKKNPRIVFQFVVFNHNRHQINDLKKLARSVGVDDYVIKTAQIYDYEKGSELIPEDESISRYRKDETGNFSIKNKLYDHCWKMWHSCVITWDGNVVPCCFDKDAKYVMGNIRDNSFRDIWNNKKYNTFRNQLLGNRQEIDICKNCSEGTEVWL